MAFLFFVDAWVSDVMYYCFSCLCFIAQASSEEELYSWMVPLRVLVGSHNLARTGAAGKVCYVDVARREELVNWRNKWV